MHRFVSSTMYSIHHWLLTINIYRMKELNDIILAYDKSVLRNKQTALATVVKVEGSSYRRPGARMLVEEDGKLTGAISGGCLEGDALRKALLVMAQQKPMLVTYDTTDEDDAKLGVQLGCNGIVHILFEPILTEDTNNPIELLKRAASKREAAVMGTLFSLEDRKAEQPGSCFLWCGNNIYQHSVEYNILEEAQKVMEKETSVITTIDPLKGMSIFLVYIEPA